MRYQGAPRVPWVLLAAALMACGPALSSTAALMEARSDAAREGLRTTLVRAWAQGRHDVAWELAADLTDDRLVRRWLAALPALALSPTLAAAEAVERARRALQAGDLPAARSAAAQALAAAGRTGTRARIVLGVALAQQRPDEARGHFEAALRTSPPGDQGEVLSNLARFSLASLAFDAGDQAAALRGYLEVEEQSGHWRGARFGIAWCQLASKRPERTLQVLDLLPGGVAGDPERAILAAMAAHQAGRIELALQIVGTAKDNLRFWDASAATSELVLAVVKAEAEGVPTRRETIVEAVAARPAVRLLGREILAASREAAALPRSPEMARYAEELGAELERVVAEEAAGEAARVASAAGDLDALVSQLEMPSAP